MSTALSTTPVPPPHRVPVAAPHSGESAPALDQRKDSRDSVPSPVAMAAGSATGMATQTKEADVNPGRWSEATAEEPKEPESGPAKRVHFADDIATDIPNVNVNDVNVDDAFVAAVDHATTEIAPGDKASLQLLTARFSMTPAQQRERLRPKGVALEDDGEEMGKCHPLTIFTVHQR